jgi:hypothetical protein
MASDFVVKDVETKCIGGHTLRGAVARSGDRRVTISGEKEDVERIVQILDGFIPLLRTARYLKMAATALLATVLEEPSVLVRARALDAVARTMERALKHFEDIDTPLVDIELERLRARTTKR